MTTTVIHQPRVAWDGACAFVRIAQTPQFGPFAAQVRERLGPDCAALLQDTRNRVLVNLTRTGGDRYAIDVEAGKWRVRLEDLLRTRPDLTGDVIELTGVARA